MCTLTYIPLKSGFVVTSNRDELAFRPTLAPKIYPNKEQELIYPKDEVANGSWIAISNQRKMACLLNGGFEKHERKAIYRKSRGIILLESLEANSFSQFIDEVDLMEIEPFTLLLFEFQRKVIIRQLVWDGQQKYVETIDGTVPQIWSSASLYSQEDRSLRKKWFGDWLRQFKGRDDYDILNFHSAKHTENSTKNILMEAEHHLQTVSISQINIQQEEAYFLYDDLKEKKETKIDLSNWLQKEIE